MKAPSPLPAASLRERFAFLLCGALAACPPPPFIGSTSIRITPFQDVTGALVKMTTGPSGPVDSVSVGGMVTSFQGAQSPYLFTIPYDLDACPYEVLVRYKSGVSEKSAFQVTARVPAKSPVVEEKVEVGFHPSAASSGTEIVVYGDNFDTNTVILVDSQPVPTFAPFFTQRTSQEATLSDLLSGCAAECSGTNGDLSVCYGRALIGLLPTSGPLTLQGQHRVEVVKKAGGEIRAAINPSFELPLRTLRLRMDRVKGQLGGTNFEMPWPQGVVCRGGHLGSLRRTFTSAGYKVDLVQGSTLDYSVEFSGSDPTLGNPYDAGNLFDFFKSTSSNPSVDWQVHAGILTYFIDDLGQKVDNLYGVRVNEPSGSGIAVFAAPIKGSPDRILRTVMHELGHALGLNHCDGEASGTTIMNQDSCLSSSWTFEFSPHGSDQLRERASLVRQPSSPLSTFTPREEDRCCFSQN